MTRKYRIATRLLSSALGLTLAPLAHAQDTAADPADEQATSSQQQAEIIVTGSRIARPGLQSATPIITSSAADLQTAAPKVFDALTQLPQFRNSASSRGLQTLAGQPGSSLLNLRNFGAQRTLVLIDGRRAPVTNDRGSTDVSLIPSEILERVDVITGGASAAYGSDAVTGAVNFILNHKYTGFKADVSAGVSTYGDAGSYRAAASFGTPFAEGRGHLVLSAEYFHQDKVGSDNTNRAWRERSPGIIINPAGTLPTRMLFLSGARSTVPTSGLVTTGPLAGSTFDTSGNAIPYSFGSPRDATISIGGGGNRNYTGIIAEQSRPTFYGRVQYELADQLTAYVEGAYGKSRTEADSQQIYLVGSSPATIFADNAYLSDATRARLAAGGASSFTMQRLFGDVPPIRTTSEAESYRVATGFNAKPGEGWSIDGYVQYSDTRITGSYDGAPLWRRLYASIDAVRSPTTGQIVCRSTLAGLDPGCVPINLFGNGGVSPAAYNYITEIDQTRILKIREWNVGLSTQKSLMRLWAEAPVTIAAGYEMRSQRIEQIADAYGNAIPDFTGLRGVPAARLATAGPYINGGFINYGGTITVHEGFLEVDAPIIADRPVFHSLTLNGALRHTRYDPSGPATTWKFSVNYQPIRDIRLRGAISRDIRAPAPFDLFPPASLSGIGTVVIPSVGAGQVPPAGQAQLNIYSVGNPQLKPERANSLSVGAVYQPSWMPGLSVSIDYFRIKLTGALAAAGTPQDVVNLCLRDRLPLACSYLQLTPTLVSSYIPTINLSQLKTRGLDIEAGYTTRIGGDGSFSIRGLATYTPEIESTVPGAVPIDRAGQVGNAKWIANVRTSLGLGPMLLSLTGRYIDRSVRDATFVEGRDINDNDVPSRFYLDTSFNYAIGRRTGSAPFEFYMTINNLLNKAPPAITLQSLGLIIQQTDPNTYDTIGRYFNTGVRVRF